MNFFGFSLVRTAQLDRIEGKINSMQRKLDTLLTLTGVPSEQLRKLLAVASDAKFISDSLEQVIEHNQ